MRMAFASSAVKIELRAHSTYLQLGAKKFERRRIIRSETRRNGAIGLHGRIDIANPPDAFSIGHVLGKGILARHAANAGIQQATSSSQKLITLPGTHIFTNRHVSPQICEHHTEGIVQILFE